MKRVVSVIAIMCTFLLLLSCNSSDKNLSKKIIGDWKAYELSHDGPNSMYFWQECGFSFKSNSIVKVGYDLYCPDEEKWRFETDNAEYDFEDASVIWDEEPQMYYIKDGRIYIGEDNESYLEYKNGELFYHTTFHETDIIIKCKRYKSKRNL